MSLGTEIDVLRLHKAVSSAPQPLARGPRNHESCCAGTLLVHLLTPGCDRLLLTGRRGTRTLASYAASLGDRLGTGQCPCKHEPPC